MRAIVFAAAAVILLVLCNTVAAQPPVTVSTDRLNYQPGDTVFVTVHVLQPAGVNSDAIWVFVTQPDGVNNYFESLPPTGGETSFTLAMDAPVGNYTLVAAWNYPAGQYVATWFTVTNMPIPEFSSSTMVLLLALAIIYGTVYGREKAASSAASRTASAPSLLR